MRDFVSTKDLTLTAQYTDRFWSRVDTRDMNGCHEWTASRNNWGYGQMGIASGTALVHRIAYHNLVGPIPEGRTIDHTCHNRACVNVDHMRLATMKQQGRNRAGVNANSKSGVLGVYWNKQRKGWSAVIKIDGAQKVLGLFDTIEEATAARKAAEVKYGWLNN